MRRINHNSALLEINQASVMRGHNLALDNITLRIEQGENVAIIGPNGSGKSTLVKTVTRECYPLAKDDASVVKILGETVWDVFHLRTKLGIVSGDLQSICDRSITGREAVISGFYGSIGVYPYHMITPKMRKRTDEVLESLEILPLADRNMNEMSTGQARRVLIARALVHDPAALVLDEPSNGLDPHAARRFSGFLRKIAKSGKSIIMVTHHLPDIIPEISRVIMLKDGKVFLDAPTAEALTDAHLSELFEMPVEVQEKNGYYYLLA